MLFQIRKYLYKLLYLIDLALHNEPKMFVLCYHSISSDWRYGVSESEFKKQIEFLSNFYNFISAKDLLNFLNGKKDLIFPSVLITFDDGYEDILKIQKFLQNKNVKPLLFLLSDPKEVDRVELATDKKLLTPKQILKLKSEGWELGSHGATHQDFWKLDNLKLKKEIEFSKQKLTKDFGQINYFAYPKGRFTPTALNIVSKSNYKLAFGMNDDFINHQTNKLLIPRIGINQTHDFTEFQILASPSVVMFRKLCKSFKLERIFA
jgi:peptidoglycan/xylan/chitin deacetylase (PgdA/CDA1 family)